MHLKDWIDIEARNLGGNLIQPALPMVVEALKAMLVKIPLR